MKLLKKTIHIIKHSIVDIIPKRLLYSFFSLFPLQNKVVGSAFYGKKYENNTKYIMEELEKINPSINKVWIKRKNYIYSVPEYLTAETNQIAHIWHYATAKIWIDTHNIPLYVKRRKNQMFIYCYHAGIFQKKIAADISNKDIRGKHNADNANVFVSNSAFLDRHIKTSLQYKGFIWRVGLPKNDVLYPGKCDHEEIKRKVLSFYNLSNDFSVVLYAPTHREDGTMLSALDMDYSLLKESLNKRFGGKWIVLMRLHPANIHEAGSIEEYFNGQIIDVNHYPDMQDLILAADVFVTDYSSTIFDVAERRIPCFMYTSDYNNFTNNIRGLYFAMKDLPFPHINNNGDLSTVICSYNYDEWQKKWEVFAEELKLCDTNDSAFRIAKLINDYVENKFVLDELDKYCERNCENVKH